MGAWIEMISNEKAVGKSESRTLHGCVDWNLNELDHIIKERLSHPTWVRGLKFLIKLKKPPKI